MPHLPITTYNSGNPPGIDAPWLDALGTQVEYIYSTYPIKPPYQLLNNASISASATNTVTCTGVGGVPSGIQAIVLFGYFNASALNLQLYFFPHGSTTGPQKIAVSTSIATDFATVIAYPDSSGKLDLTAGSGGNIAGLYMWMGAYIY